MSKRRGKDEVTVWKMPSNNRVYVEIPNGCEIHVMSNKIRIGFHSYRAAEECLVDILGRPLLAPKAKA